MKIKQSVILAKFTALLEKMGIKDDAPKLKLAKISEINKWDITVDQDEIIMGTLLTQTFGDDEPSRIYSGEYALENGSKIQVDSDGKVVMLTPKVELAIIKTEDKKELSFSKLEKGEQVTMLSEENQIPVPVGEYKLEDGRTLKFEEVGVIAEIIEKPIELATVTTADGKELSYETLETGQAITILEGEEQIPAPDATYIITDGSSIIVVDGMISELVEKTEEEPEIPEALAEAFNKVAEVNTLLLAKIEASEATSIALKAEFEAFKAAAQTDPAKHGKKVVAKLSAEDKEAVRMEELKAGIEAIKQVKK